ncbi:MAG: hypothetical protein SPLM_03370 [Spiroplasma phoeniceum]|uniref:hypothetical protein n=1 Tax=Spiroplasma phoeniceum TaxID=47835 RepID=UPI003272A0B6
MQTLKELKPDLFVEEQISVSPTNFIKDMIEKSTENKNDEIETIKEKGAYTADEIKKIVSGYHLNILFYILSKIFKRIIRRKGYYFLIYLFLFFLFIFIKFFFC